MKHLLFEQLGIAHHSPGSFNLLKRIQFLSYATTEASVSMEQIMVSSLSQSSKNTFAKGAPNPVLSFNPGLERRHDVLMQCSATIEDVFEALVGPFRSTKHVDHRCKEIVRSNSARAGNAKSLVDVALECGLHRPRRGRQLSSSGKSIQPDAFQFMKIFPTRESSSIISARS